MKKQHPNFPDNLRIASSQYSSVAEVCRSLQINRQQFNKYLSGQVYPNQHNLQRICHFFGISAQQFDLSTAEFSLSLQSQSEEARPENPIERIIDALPDASETLEHYVGYYYSHFHALGYPGSIIRSLIHLYRANVDWLKQYCVGVLIAHWRFYLSNYRNSVSLFLRKYFSTKYQQDLK